MSIIQDRGSKLRLPVRQPCEKAVTPLTAGPPVQFLTCVCSNVWKVIRIPLDNIISEHMTCTCGEVLMHWVEAADYRFEPLEDVL